MKIRSGFVSNSSSSSFIVDVPKDFTATKEMIEQCDSYYLEDLFDTYGSEKLDYDEDGINQEMVDAVNQAINSLKIGNNIHRGYNDGSCFWAVQDILERENHIVMVTNGPGGDGEDEIIVFKDLRKTKRK